MKFKLQMGRLKIVLCAMAVVCMVALLYFCVFYRVHSYEYLRDWFVSLNSCFYQKETFTTNFFTPAAKAMGDKLVVLCGAMSVVLLVYCGWRMRNLLNRPTERIELELSVVALRWYAAAGALALTSGCLSWHSMAPAYDEIFSAVNCAELHPFQTLSYYMLPNNHIWFNLANNVLFGWYHHLVATGRSMSLAAYMAVALLAFGWFRRVLGSYLLAFLAVIPIAFQFTVWGMAAQARGYELQLLCAWVGFVTTYSYIADGRRNRLWVNAFFNILGFAFVPTYLFIYVAQVVVVLGMMVHRRRLDWHYFLWQVLFGCFVLALFTPALCYSGFDAFLNNHYVQAATDNWIAYLPDFMGAWTYFINFCFSFLVRENHPLNFILFLLPLLLFFAKNSNKRLLAVYYTMLWVVFAVLVIKMRHNPFNRNMIAHYSLTMALVVYTIFSAAGWAAGFFRSRQLSRGIATGACAVFALGYGSYLLYTDLRDVSQNLYFNNVNKLYADHVADASKIDAKASIGFSDESFFMYYCLHNNHPGVTKCRTGHEDYFIKRTTEHFDSTIMGTYLKVQDLTDDHELYRRR